MRSWTVRELDDILYDMTFIESFDDPEDCAWLAERITIRATHGERVMGQCDGCPEGYTSVVTCVTAYPDDMGAPDTLGVSYVCTYHAQTY